jgi:hypothetical protein
VDGAEPHRWVQDPLIPSGWRWTGDDPPAPGESGDVPERPDGWCENRAPGQITDRDEVD